MATMYVAWHKYDRIPVNGQIMQIEGPFISSQAVDISSGGSSTEAPSGAEYAEIWSDVAFWFRTDGSASASSNSKPYPANEPIQVPGIAVAGTKISGTAL